MNSTKVLSFIDQIAANPSKNDKQALLGGLVQFPEFKRVCEYAYNPFKTYGVRQMPDRAPYGSDDQFDDTTWAVLDALIARELTGTAARSAIENELNRLSDESADLFTRIIRKDLRAGFSESSINKACKGLIPEFPYMRCSLPKDANLEDWPWEDGVISQEKADGMFANIDYEHCGLVAIRSRQGTELPVEKFEKLLEDIRKRVVPGHQLHGEFVIVRDNVILAREIGNGIMNSIINGGDFESGDVPTFLVWDAIPLEKVTSKGKYEAHYKNRLTNLAIALRTHDPKDSTIKLIPTKVVKSLKEAYAHAVELMKQGKEGTVIKHPGAIWKDGTSKEQVKLKLEFDVDLEVVAVVPGRDGTKNEGRPGSLTCKSSDGLLLVDVTVKNEAMRKDVEESPDNWIGSIITVIANDIMVPSESNNAYSLFLPRMKEASYRADKRVADTLQRIFAIKEMAITGERLMKEAA